MILEYILIGIIAFSAGHSSGKRKCKHKHREQIVVVHKHKHKKPKFRKKWRNHKRRHIHRNHWKF